MNTSNAPRNHDPGWEAEYDTIRDLLSQKFMRLRFPVHLETELRTRMHTRAIVTLQESGWMLFLMVAAMAALVLYQFTDDGHWLGNDGDFKASLTILFGGLAGVTLLIVLTQFRALDRYYYNYLRLIVILILLVLTVGPAFVTDPSLRQRCTYAVIYILMMVYGVGNLRLLQSTSIGFASMGLSALIVALLGKPFDWTMFTQYYLLTNLIGIGNGYIVETKERRLFLQSHLLVLEKRQLNRLSERMVQVAREDGLTGLANRRHFSDSFLLEWERGRRERLPMALIFVDIDHFKAFNDTYGHLEGDRALVAVASAMKPLARRPGDLAARYGGEEFVLLMPNTPLEGATEVARELLVAVDALNIAHRASSVEPYVTVSIGVASILPDVHLAPTQLLDAADAALYEAKEAGRHQVVVSRGL